MYDPQTQQQIAEWRRKVMDNTITKEEMQKAIIVLRQGRLLAATQAKAGKAKKAVRSADELLSEL